MSEKYAPMCALNTAHQYFYEHEYDIKILGKVNDMFTYCRTNIPLPYQHSCFYGIGEITSHHAGWNHKDAIIKNCMQGTGWEEQSECFKAAIQRLTWIDHNEAIDFCNQIPEEHKKTCDSLVRISKK